MVARPPQPGHLGHVLCHARGAEVERIDSESRTFFDRLSNRTRLQYMAISKWALSTHFVGRADLKSHNGYKKSLNK